MIQNIIHALTGNQWVQLWALILGLLVSIDHILSFIAPLTKNTYDDRVSSLLGNLVSKFIKKNKFDPVENW